MSFIVEQKNKGKIYLYKATNYWDKDKKQSRQKREYIGPKNKDKKSDLNLCSTDIRSRIFGTSYFLSHIAHELGLPQIVKNIFPEDYNEILALAYYDICEAQPQYLFHYWQQENFLAEIKVLDSKTISSLYQKLGKSDALRLDFFSKWIEHLNPIEAVYYDITSISSYSGLNEMVEPGYNRDNENLSQINMGVVCCQHNSLPVYYNPYQGSIVDVTTLKNCMEYLRQFGIKRILLMLDRGFFSCANIKALNEPENKFDFIQPVPMTVKKARELYTKHHKQLQDTQNAFMYNNDLLYYCKTELQYADDIFDAHLYYDEATYLAQKQNFLCDLLTFENQLKNQSYQNRKDFISYKNTDMPAKFRAFFKWNRTEQKVEKDTNKIKKHLSERGKFLLISNRKNLNSTIVLDYYRMKDRVEKLFDIIKNEMDTERVRTHSNYNTEGKLFIRFIALIIYSKISDTMKQKELFDKFTIKELLCELKKIKHIQIGNNNPIYSEVSKRQKTIFNAFNINWDKIA